MPTGQTGVVACSSSLPLRSHPGSHQAETPLTAPVQESRANSAESFNGKLRDALLNAEVFNTLAEAKVLIEQWRVHFNTVRPHSALGCRPPAPEVIVLGLPMPPGNPVPTGPPPPLVPMLR